MLAALCGIWIVCLAVPSALPLAIVVSFHPAATGAAVQMLNENGNAFDAFVAATLAEYVVNEGGTSPAGSLGALTYDAKTGKTEYLDAEFNGLLDPRGQWDSRR